MRTTLNWAIVTDRVILLHVLNLLPLSAPKFGFWTVNIVNQAVGSSKVLRRTNQHLQNRQNPIFLLSQLDEIVVSNMFVHRYKEKYAKLQNKAECKIIKLFAHSLLAIVVFGSH